ncbi:hypothetical protein GGF31_006920 [Allomyces arbusculus]|nr:hypothetical protein GGF31_006920 [Allomyces arbusculus]
MLSLLATDLERMRKRGLAQCTMNSSRSPRSPHRPSPDGKLFTHRLACRPADGINLAAPCASSQVPVKSFGGIKFSVVMRPSADAVAESAANFAIDVGIAATFDAHHVGKVFLVTGALLFKRTGVAAGTKTQQTQPFSLTIAVPTLTSPTTPVCDYTPIILPFSAGSSLPVLDLAVTATWRQLTTLSLAKHVRQVPEQLGFLRFLHDERVSDCAFLTKGSGTPLYASRVMLAKASTFFRTIFSGAWRESTTANPIRFDSWHAAAMALVLIHIYSGWVPGEPHPSQTPDRGDLVYATWRNLLDLAEMLGLKTLAMTVIQQLKTLLDEQLRDLSLTADSKPESDDDDDAVDNFKKRRHCAARAYKCCSVPTAFGFLTPTPASGFSFGASSSLTWSSIQFDMPLSQVSSSSAPSTGGKFSFASTANVLPSSPTAATTPGSSFSFTTFAVQLTDHDEGIHGLECIGGAAAPLLTTTSAPASSTGTFLFASCGRELDSRADDPDTGKLFGDHVLVCRDATRSGELGPRASTPDAHHRRKLVDDHVFICHRESRGDQCSAGTSAFCACKHEPVKCVDGQTQAQSFAASSRVESEVWRHGHNWLPRRLTTPTPMATASVSSTHALVRCIHGLQSASGFGAGLSAFGSFAVTALHDSSWAGGRFMDTLAAVSSCGSTDPTAESAGVQAAAGPAASPASLTSAEPNSVSPPPEPDESSLSGWTNTDTSSSSSIPLIDLANESVSEAEPDVAQPMLSTPEPETSYVSGMTFTRPRVTPSSPAWPFAPQSLSAVTTTDLPPIFRPAAG